MVGRGCQGEGKGGRGGQGVPGEVRPLDEGGAGAPLGVMTREQRLAWSDSSTGKIFLGKEAQKSHPLRGSARPGNWLYWFSSLCKWTTKRYKWFSSSSDWVPLWGSTNICWFCFHFGFIKFTTHPSDTLPRFSAAVLLVRTSLVIGQ